MHIADMQLVRPGEHTLGDGVATGNDQVVRRHVELLDGQWHQRKILLVMRFGLGQLLDEGRRGAFATETGSIFIGKKVDHGEQVGFRPGLEQPGEHVFGARIGHQPIMNNGDFHTIAFR